MPENSVTPMEAEKPEAPVTPVTPVVSTPVATAVSATPVAPKKKSKTLMIVGVVVLLLLCCCVSVLGIGYVFLKNGDITLNGVCYKGIDNVFANKTVPCPGVTGGDGSINPALLNGNDAPAVQNPTTPNTPANPAGGTQLANDKAYSTSEYTFNYPSSWVQSTDSTGVLVTTPEGDYIKFAKSTVEETGTLTDATCTDFANSYLDSIKTDLDPAASLVNHEVSTVGKYTSCVFDVDYTSSNVATHLRFVYVIEGGRGLLMSLSATDNSTLMTEMLNVLDTLVLK